MQDANEAGVSGVTVTPMIFGQMVLVAIVLLLSILIHANGNYIFTDLPANTNYIVGITPPAGGTATSAAEKPHQEIIQPTVILVQPTRKPRKYGYGAKEPNYRH
ncbi:MAG: hypothetical protein V9F02_09985 [Chitinophagaceae bacterium]